MCDDESDLLYIDCCGRADFEPVKMPHIPFSSGVVDVGSYDFYTTIVSLESIEKVHLDNIKFELPHIKKVKSKSEKLKLGTYEKLKKIYPLAHHEYTHYVESTSTLWGMKYLLEMKEAYLQNREKYQSNAHRKG